MTTFDFSEVMKLAADLGEAEINVVPFARKAVEVTANNIKKDWRKFSKDQNIDGSLKGYPNAIDYDMLLDTDGMIGADIGPNLGKFQGSFGFVEDGGPKVLSAPRHDGADAAKFNRKDFEEGLLKAGVDALNA